MEFATNFKRHPRKQETFSNKMQKVYKTTYNKKTGKRTQEVEKEINIYDKIQEYRDELKITNILQRYNLDMLKQLKDKEEQLIDLTNLPGNLMETMDIIDNAKYAWDRQSKIIKEKFNNDFKEFIAASETGQLAKVLNEELKVSAERFNISNMANYNQVESFRTYPTAQETRQQAVEQPTMQQTMQTNINVGGNTNV